ncbi:MAG: xanthine dehydrogenase family protein molybdopterin-binding subunit [Pseudolabrys sp.]|nr:xanthine dehydrogenase family protein molybdopterin-binding subunit [Pseudolabrys sp.]
MNNPSDDAALSLMKFGIGQPVPRTEDPTLVRGRGRYTDDVNKPNQAYAVMVRSREAHGVIRGIDTDAASKMPGVLAVLTAKDLEAYGGMKCALPIKNKDGSPLKTTVRPALTADKVRFVGDPVACVVAQTLGQAKDAAEAVAVDIDPLPAVTKASEAAKSGAPQLYDDIPGNIALDYHYGDSAKVEAAFQSAEHTVKLDLLNTRLIVAAMEPRAAIGEFDKGRWVLTSCSQGAFGLKGSLVDILKAKPEEVRVLTGNVGGSFGMKAAVYPEYICILHAAKALGRAVKWTDERTGSFVSDHHGRDHEMTGELALDKDGTFLALRFTGYGNMGAYLNPVSPLMPTLNAVKNTASVYKTALIEVSSKCVYTNTTLVSAYRGAGRPEGNYYVERLIDTAAREMGIDRLELRRRNFIKPKEMPYHAASDMTYDSGDFPAVFKRALEMSDYKGFTKRKRESKRAGKLRGIGVGCFLEVTAPPNKEMGGLRFEANGDVTIITGTLDYGQGHAAPYAQVLTTKLGIPFEKIKLLQGDSDELIAGGGTGGSRSITASGQAIVEASAKVIENGKQIAAHVLEASAGDIEFKNGRFVIAGTDRAVGIMELAAKLRGGLKLPEGMPKTLDVKHASEPVQSSFPNGCHIAEVEIDPATGETHVVKYTGVSDFGTIINPLLVDGQVHGGVVQGIGQALMEVARYDSDGQFITGSFMDYAMPRAHDAPPFVTANVEVPAKSNPLGTKGCGEAGCAGGLASVMNAIVDALAERGITHLDMPASPPRVWAALQAAPQSA